MRIPQYQQQVSQDTVVGYRKPTTSVKTQAQQIKATQAAAEASRVQGVLQIGMQALSLGDQIAQSQSEAEMLKIETETYKRLDDFTLSLDKMSWTEYDRAWQEERTKLQNELHDKLKLPRSKKQFDQFFERQANEHGFKVKNLEIDRRNAQYLADGMESVVYHTKKGDLPMAVTTIRRLERSYIISPEQGRQLERQAQEDCGYWAIRNGVMGAGDIDLKTGLEIIEKAEEDIMPETREKVKAWWKDEHNFRENQYEIKFTEQNRTSMHEIIKTFDDGALRREDIVGAIGYDDFRKGAEGKWNLTPAQKEHWLRALDASEDDDTTGADKTTWVDPTFRAELNEMLKSGTDREVVLKFVDDSIDKYHPTQWDNLRGLVDKFRPDLNLGVQYYRVDELAIDDAHSSDMQMNIDIAVRDLQKQGKDVTTEDVERITDEIISVEIEEDVEGWFNQIKTGGLNFKQAFFGGVEGEEDFDKLKRLETAIQEGTIDPNTAKAVYKTEIKKLYAMEQEKFSETMGIQPTMVEYDAEHQVEQVLTDEYNTRWTYNDGQWMYYNPATDGWVKISILRNKISNKKRKKIADNLSGE